MVVHRQKSAKRARPQHARLAAWMGVVVLWLVSAGCQAAPAAIPTVENTDLKITPDPTATIAASPTISPTLPPTLTPSPTTTPQNLTVWIDPGLPQALRSSVQLPDGYSVAESAEQAGVRLQPGGSQPASQWLYVAAAAFPSYLEDVRVDALRKAWIGETQNTSFDQPILLTGETVHTLSAVWGQPVEAAIQVLVEAELLDAAWENRQALAIIPFENLEPRWKVITLDGQSPLEPGFTPSSYPLVIPVSLVPSQQGDSPLEANQLGIPASNFQADQLTRLMLTGVTALVRGTALTMEARGVTYPAQDILPWLQQADILHISNEIPFYSLCPKPELYPPEIKFCSDPAYIELLEEIGTDVIELDGDHFGDYGTQAMLETLALYQERGWPYYGGGANSQEASQAVFLEHHGNRFAFIGCNAKGIGYYASATQTNPGAVQCDFDWLSGEVTRLRDEGYLVIATFQHNEYYTYQAQPDLIRDFQQVAQAGAVIVSGSQAHQPHGMEFLNGSFIHYGLGNLFFDQYRFFPGPELDRAFIDQHYFYAGRYIGTQLLTIKFIDLARSRPATPEERLKFLQDIFTASGW
jgi:hypothetical protein